MGCDRCGGSFGHFADCGAVPMPRLEYDGGPGHVTGDATSEASARAGVESGSIGRLQAKVLGVLDDRGKIGATSFEAEAMLAGLHQSVSSTLRNLELAGDVVRLVETRPNPQTHRDCRVYALRSVADRYALPTVAPNPRRSGAQRNTGTDDGTLL